MIPESTYQFSAEFEPSPLYTYLYYIIMVCMAAGVLLLIMDREIVGEEGSYERKVEEGEVEVMSEGDSGERWRDRNRWSGLKRGELGWVFDVLAYDVV